MSNSLQVGNGIEKRKPEFPPFVEVVRGAKEPLDLQSS